MIFLRYLTLITVILLAGCGRKPVPKPEIEELYARVMCQYENEENSELIPQKVDYDFYIIMKLSGEYRHAFPRTITAHITLDGEKKSMIMEQGMGINIICYSKSTITTTLYAPLENLRTLNISDMTFEINISDGKKNIPYVITCTPDMLDQIRSVQ